MLTFLIIIIGLSLLILGHEFGHFAAAKLFGLKVDEFGFGFPPRLFAWQKGETKYSLNWLPFGGFVKIAGENDSINDAGAAEVEPAEKNRLFYFQPAWKRAIVLVAGVTVNFIIGWIMVSFIFMVGTPTAIFISNVENGSPAATAGLKNGDIVRNYYLNEAEKQPAGKIDDFISFINANRGKELTLELIREKGEETVRVVPRADESEPGLGVVLQEAGVPKTSFFRAFYEGLIQSSRMVWMTFVSFLKLIQGLVFRGSLLPGIVGPVGIISVAQEAGEIGLIYLFQLIALISINLAVINLLPFPALDGGRLFMILIEKIKGAPLSRRTEALANGIGFLFLISLIILITIRDISRWL